MTVSVSKMKKETILPVACVVFLLQNTMLHAAPPIESCPHDSVQVGESCKCAPEQCSKPICPYELVISANSTETPGSCCPIYSCEGCANETLIEGKCPCAADAVLDSHNQCVCIDPHKALVDGECVCDPNLCDLPQLCAPNSVAVTEHSGCCATTKCIKCHDDSFATSNSDDAIEDKCVCYPCKAKECGPNERVVIMEKGNNFPGSCCDLYRCDKLPLDGCVVEGVVYGEGELWKTPDAQLCKCQGGISFCSKPNEDEGFRSCHKEGAVYKHKEWWMLDSCTNCTCLDGEPKCIAHMCEVTEGYVQKPECQPLNCTKECPDGYKLNKRGCKICKCSGPKYDDLLRKYNITNVSKLKDVLDAYFAHKFDTTAENPAQDNNGTFFQNKFNPATNDSNCSRMTDFQWFLSIGGVFAIVLIILVIIVVKCRSQRNKGSYDTNPTGSTIYERMTLTKDALFNNNYIGNDAKNKKKMNGSV